MLLGLWAESMASKRAMLALSTFFAVYIYPEFSNDSYSYPTEKHEKIEAKEINSKLSGNKNAKTSKPKFREKIHNQNNISKKKITIETPHTKSNIKKSNNPTKPVNPIKPNSEDKNPLRVIIGQSLVLNFDTDPVKVIIGDDRIANITALEKEKSIIITAKNNGLTNLLILGSGGKVLLDTALITSENEKNTVRVYNPDKVDILSCSPTCAKINHE
ncbi:MAG: hypothetical protein C4617_01305 [Candidatus Liberibacter europaeus]|uniref:Pilus formation protein N-terminal domain-containing protein n=1 Tax=Candidatus Liberibacter europaeus TaxID=744859 RepID=A0A2T4VZ68_9HYPH|nr:hypothetical protein [Candidatus Liberibacter europaeus]PTL87066.1 MAG: hypothetical protein C4617_01305 [Candidatus Liberibacter europaeus]